MAAREGMPKRKVGYVALTLQFEREDDQWVGTCIELGTSTFAHSLEQVQEELHELVGLHLNGLETVGERERFFENHGIQIQRTTQTEAEEVTLRVPWPSLKQLGPPIRKAPLFQPHLFPFPEHDPEDRLVELVSAGA